MRNSSLDILRFWAIALVLGRHIYEVPPEISAANLHYITHKIIQFGWIGVDLFFVISGFLISGLLFKDPRIKNFYIRRGFKIYPVLLAYLGISSLGLLWVHYLNCPVVFSQKGFWIWFSSWLIPNLLFIQNYLEAQEISGFWSLKVTWSLAIEEHFYLVLPLILWVMRVVNKSYNLIPKMCLGIGIACLAFRYLAASGEPFTVMGSLVPTHLRMDGLFFGVYLGYVYAYDKHLWDWLASKKWSLLGIASIMLAPNLFLQLHESKYIYTLGYTANYLAFGCILVALFNVNFGTNIASKFMIFVGQRSYSLYLWHTVGAWLALKYINPIKSIDNWLMTFSIYIIFSIVFACMSYSLVEAPMLKLRNKMFQ